METQVLGVAELSRSYVLQSDTSERGLGVVLSQADHQGQGVHVGWWALTCQCATIKCNFHHYILSFTLR